MLCMASSVRRDVSPATPLRTGPISRDAVSAGLWNRFLAVAPLDISCHLELCRILVTIDGAGGEVKDLEHQILRWPLRMTESFRTE